MLQTQAGATVRLLVPALGPLLAGLGVDRLGTEADHDRSDFSNLGGDTRGTVAHRLIEMSVNSINYVDAEHLASNTIIVCAGSSIATSSSSIT